MTLPRTIESPTASGGPQRKRQNTSGLNEYPVSASPKRGPSQGRWPLHRQPDVPRSRLPVRTTWSATSRSLQGRPEKRSAHIHAMSGSGWVGGSGEGSGSGSGCGDGESGPGIGRGDGGPGGSAGPGGAGVIVRVVWSTGCDNWVMTTSFIPSHARLMPRPNRRCTRGCRSPDPPWTHGSAHGPRPPRERRPGLGLREVATDIAM